MVMLLSHNYKIFSVKRYFCHLLVQNKLNNKCGTFKISNLYAYFKNVTNQTRSSVANQQPIKIHRLKTQSRAEQGQASSM